MRTRLSLLAFLIAAPLVGQPDNLWVVVNDSAKLKKFWGVDKITKRATKISEMKLAIISHGFEGVKDEMTRFLPEGTEIVGNESIVPRSLAKFGRQNAQVAWAVTGYEAAGPQIRLYDGATPGTLEDAIDSIKTWRPDVVLNTENLEGYGNFDGKGVLNARIEELVKLHDTLWIQSAGTYRGRAYNAPVRIAAGQKNEKWVQFANQMSIKLPIRSEKTDVMLTLSWNANRRTVSGKGKDLDLYLYASNAQGAVVEPPIAKSTLQQVTTPGAGEGKTVFPVEQLTAEGLPSSDYPYQIVVKYRGGEFDPAVDSLRVTLTSEKEPYPDDKGELVFPIEMEGAQSTEQIMVPSDNPHVITVGDLSPWSSVGEMRDGVVVRKPDLILDWIKVPFSDGGALPSGPHAAAASLAGVAIVMKAAEPSFGLRHLRALVRKMQMEREASRPPLDVRTAKADLKKMNWKFDPKGIQKILENCGAGQGVPGKLDRAVVAARAHGGACAEVGVSRPLADIPYLVNLQDWVKRSPHRHEVFAYPDRTRDKLEFKLALRGLSDDWPWVKDRDIPSRETIAIAELGYYDNSRDFTQATSLRWETPTDAELKALVNN